MVVAGGAQLSLNDKSRVSREAQARFREGLGVKLPGATRPSKWVGWVNAAAFAIKSHVCVKVETTELAVGS